MKRQAVSPKVWSIESYGTTAVTKCFILLGYYWQKIRFLGLGFSWISMMVQESIRLYVLSISLLLYQWRISGIFNLLVSIFFHLLLFIQVIPKDTNIKEKQFRIIDVKWKRIKDWKNEIIFCITNASGKFIRFFFLCD